MGAKSGLALKALQWFFRGVQFCCAAIILGIFSYFLATLHNHNIHISNDIRAVEGISGAAVLYTIFGLLLLCCFAGLTFTSFIAIVLDVCFIGAFIYVAVVNRGGASSCSGYLDTPFGKGQSRDTTTEGTGGFTNLPSFHTACRLQTACLAVAIIAIFFFVFSILMEVALVRHHKKAKRYGPSPANNYTSGYGSTRKGGIFGRFRNRNRGPAGVASDENKLPEHTQPSQLGGGGGAPDARQSYATETTAVSNDPMLHANPYAQEHSKYETTGHGYYPQHQQSGVVPHGPTHPQDYRYEDGVYDRNA